MCYAQSILGLKKGQVLPCEEMALFKPVKWNDISIGAGTEGTHVCVNIAVPTVVDITTAVLSDCSFVDTSTAAVANENWFVHVHSHCR